MRTVHYVQSTTAKDPALAQGVYVEAESPEQAAWIAFSAADIIPEAITSTPVRVVDGSLRWDLLIIVPRAGDNIATAEVSALCAFEIAQKEVVGI